MVINRQSLSESIQCWYDSLAILLKLHSLSPLWQPVLFSYSVSSLPWATGNWLRDCQYKVTNLYFDCGQSLVPIH